MEELAEIREIREIIRTELPEAIARVILEKQQNLPQWVDIRKASQALDCSPKLLKSMIDRGVLIPRTHYIDLTPDEYKRTYRFNLESFSKKDLRSGLTRR
jgi:hypothetical protein